MDFKTAIALQLVINQTTPGGIEGFFLYVC